MIVGCINIIVMRTFIGVGIEMTREEKLDWLYRLRSEIYVYMPKEWLIPMNEALDYAIKVLEQESCEGDAISRKHLEEIIKFVSEMSADETDDFKLGVSVVSLLIKAEPSIQPKYKKAIEDIKAELKSKVFSEDWVDNVVYLDDCLEIIDKHTAESEEI